MWTVLFPVMLLALIVVVAYTTEEGKKHREQYLYWTVAVGLLVSAFGIYLFYEANTQIGEVEDNIRFKGLSYATYWPNSPIIGLVYRGESGNLAEGQRGHDIKAALERGYQEFTNTIRGQLGKIRGLALVNILAGAVSVVWGVVGVTTARRP